MMTAVEYLKEKARMTKSCTISCPDCPLCWTNNDLEVACNELENDYPEEALKVVEKWSEENPVKTRMVDFFEKFPKAMKRKSGVPLVCANHMGYCSDRDCGERESCCTDCWDRPLE